MSNPLIKLEFMRRFRSSMAAWGIPLVVLLPGIAVIGVYASSVALSRSGTLIGGPGFDDGSNVLDAAGFQQVLDPNSLPRIGAGMFGAVAATLFITLVVLVPAFVGGSIAGERNSQTLQPLQLTAMSPVQIVFGKLISSMSYLMVALLSTAPVLVIPFLLGGISIRTVFGSFILMVVVSVEFAAISLAVSSLMARPAPAIIVSLLSAGFITVAPFVIMGMSMATAVSGNPNFRADSSSLRYIAGFSPISLGSWLVDPNTEFRINFVGWGDRLGSLFWCVSLTVAALAIACRKVRAPVERDR